MRVLQLIDSLDAGGAERMAVNLANALSERIDSSYLCTTRAEGLLKDAIVPNVGYMFLNKCSTYDIKAYRRFIKFIKTEQIDIVHAHSTSFFLGTLAKLVSPKLTLVWHDHYGNSEMLSKRPHKVLQWCSGYFDWVYCVNENLQNWVKTHLKCKHVFYLSNFVDVLDVKDEETRLKGQDGKRIVCLANLRPQKDHITLLRAFKQIKHMHPDWSLHLVGKDFDDDYAQNLRTFIVAEGLIEHVFLYGSCKDVGYILKQCTIGVLSSCSEGLPLALLEYGLGALAVVATNVGDCKKVIVDAQHGQLVQAEDAEALSEAIQVFINDFEFRAESARVLHAFVKQHYSKSAVIARVCEDYQKGVVAYE
ncbi:glycosyltransferase [Meridianimaribacter sp. CL38]|uniref:glycosyltransferase n=1 Tax=Meridianimaribacter sp. CL38 TaxID=2213021 RepID=UPI00103B9957|nr:glycosyltransferase [Meridianimaribacter sp. CL38]TBV25517.1 glycosyltransferase [Meridianimaribacter sp. CL38]